VREWLRRKFAKKATLERSGPRKSSSNLVFENKQWRGVTVNLNGYDVYIEPGDQVIVTAEGVSRGHAYGSRLEELADDAKEAVADYAIDQLEEAGLTRV
jgi:hypothetical protein